MIYWYNIQGTSAPCSFHCYRKLNTVKLVQFVPSFWEKTLKQHLSIMNFSYCKSNFMIYLRDDDRKLYCIILSQRKFNLMLIYSVIRSRYYIQDIPPIEMVFTFECFRFYCIKCVCFHRATLKTKAKCLCSHWEYVCLVTVHPIHRSQVEIVCMRGVALAKCIATIVSKAGEKYHVNTMQTCAK